MFSILNDVNHSPPPPIHCAIRFGVSISVSVDFQSQFTSELWLQIRKEIILILNERKVYSQIRMKPPLGLVFDFCFLFLLFPGPGEDCKWRSTQHMAKYLRYMCAKSLQSCPTPCDPMDCGPPGSSIHGSLQAYDKSRLLCSPPGGLPHPETEPASLLHLLH